MSEINAAEYLCSYSSIHEQMMNKPEFVFPGKKSLCSTARIKVASVDQVIAGLHIRLTEDCVIALTLQQFYCWNCRAECSTAGRDHLGLIFSLYLLRDGRALAKTGEAANRGASI